MTCHLLFAAAAIRYAIADTQCHRGPPGRSSAGFRFHAGVTGRRKDTQAQEDHNVFGDSLRSPGSGYEPGSSVYLGDDPDPNIRFLIMRDISGRFGGDSN
jgi:hypothetical protein